MDKVQSKLMKFYERRAMASKQEDIDKIIQDVKQEAKVDEKFNDFLVEHGFKAIFSIFIDKMGRR